MGTRGCQGIDPVMKCLSSGGRWHMAPLFTPWKVKGIPGDPALDSMSLRKRFLPSHNVGKKKSFLFDQNHLEKTTAIEHVCFLAIISYPQGRTQHLCCISCSKSEGKI